MARKFETADIVSPVKARFSKRSLTHMNTSWDELGEDVIKSIIGTYTTNDIIILHGCIVAVTSGAIPGTGTATLSAGAIYYNGRIYRVDANASLSTTNPQTLVWSIIESTISGDPATFDDGNPYDFHIIEKFRLTAGTSGSGLANYDGATVKYLKRTATANTNYTAFSTSNCSLSNAQYNLVKQGDLVTMSFFATISVTTGASNAQVIFNLISNIDFIASGQMIGTFHARNDSANSHIAQRMISNGLNTTDISIDSNKRVKLDLTGGSVSNGESVNFVVQFTARTTV